MKKIAPSILSADFANLERDVRALAAAGADWVHVDVMDGHFVPNLTIGAPVVKALKKISPLPLDVHLMIEKPERYIDDFLKAGSDWLTIHVESTTDVAGCLKRIREGGAKAGLTLRPGTSLQTVLPYLDQVDLVLVMTVEPGFGGQSFMEDQLEKISTLRREIDSRRLPVLIEVDGGINEKTAALCAEADVLVAGSYVFKGEVAVAIRTLKNA
ncbi:MAG TPA: ribulose-phosphate 3-epimerase [Pseudobdellovibrionaceae bacterium]|nr:ribulose-phosphate 3-epimerase [Pseudobdellovibrionaceae bacterium]